MAQNQKDSTNTLLLRGYVRQTFIIPGMFFWLQLEVGYLLPTEHVQFLMERILHGLLHSPFPRIDVMITLGIGDVDTPLNRVFFRIFLDYVLPEEIQDYCSIFIVYHQRDIYDYRLESVILM